MSSVIEQLRDDKQYYAGVGKNYLSNSDIGTLLKNPKEYGMPREDNKNFLLGRYFHQLILEPEKAEAMPHIDVASRNTKAYKEFCAENGFDIAMLSKERAEVDTWVDTIKSNMDFFDAINEDGNVFEEPAVGKLFGEMWKGKADIVGNKFVYDLKTTSSIDDFKWNSRKYNYDSQAYIYEQLFGKPMVFLVIDKTNLMMGKFTVSEESLERGKEKVKQAVEIYNRFFGENPTADINQFYYEAEI